MRRKLVLLGQVIRQHAATRMAPGRIVLPSHHFPLVSPASATAGIPQTLATAVRNFSMQTAAASPIFPGQASRVKGDSSGPISRLSRDELYSIVGCDSTVDWIVSTYTTQVPRAQKQETGTGYMYRRRHY